MKISPPHRVTRTYTQRLVAEPSRVFTLLCPVREADWIEGWNPLVVLSHSGVAEPDCVFLTGASHPEAIWYVTRHDPRTGFIEMLKITPTVTACRVSILVRQGSGGSEAEITYTHTSLGPAGDAFIASFTEDHYRRFMGDWEARMNHYLSTGAILRAWGGEGVTTTGATMANSKLQPPGGTASAPEQAAAKADSACGLIDARIKELDDWRGALLSRLRALIKAADPEVTEEWKWRGTPVWSHHGIICTGETYKKVVKMTFAKGASLADPSRLFNASLDGNVRRAIDFHEGASVDEDALKALIRAALAENSASARGRSK